MKTKKPSRRPKPRLVKSSPTYNGVEVALAALSTPQKKATPDMLGKLLGLSRSAVFLWKGVIPLNRVTQVAILTGVPREKLRPDQHAPLPAQRRTTRAA